MTPALKVLADGKPVSPAFYRHLLSASIRLDTDAESDTAEFTFEDDGTIDLPGAGTRLTVHLGYGDDLVDLGCYVYAGLTISGDPEEGRRLILTARAADLTAAMKAPRSDHWDLTSLGEAVGRIAQRYNLAPLISASLAAKPLAYAAQIRQSDLDWLTRQGEAVGAIVKPLAGKLVVAARDGRTVGGQPLPTFVIRPPVLAWEATHDPRNSASTAESSWWDREAGESKTETATAAPAGPRKAARHLAPSRAAAAAQAQAMADRTTRQDWTGWVDVPGNPDLVEGAPLEIGGLRPGIDGRWVINAVEHTVDDGGFRSRIKFGAPSSGARKGGSTADASWWDRE